MSLDVIQIFASLGAEINDINRANGWRVVEPCEWCGDGHPYKVPAILALIHSEVSEALEAFRVGDKANFAEELADVVIRVLDCANGLEIDLGTAVLDKMAKNRQRAYRHGGKKL
jgi:NTP pyrophosphatase (non-canonical NTP hydrolase)